MNEKTLFQLALGLVDPWYVGDTAGHFLGFQAMPFPVPNVGSRAKLMTPK
jgi:hypothetical protein